jgi:hypothetical protein
MCLFGLAKWFWPNILAKFDEVGKLRHQSLTIVKEECNKFDVIIPLYF